MNNCRIMDDTRLENCFGVWIILSNDYTTYYGNIICNRCNRYWNTPQSQSNHEQYYYHSNYTYYGMICSDRTSSHKIMDHRYGISRILYYCWNTQSLSHRSIIQTPQTYESWIVSTRICRASWSKRDCSNQIIINKNFSIMRSFFSRYI